MAVGNFDGLTITGRSTVAVTKKRAIGYDDAQITVAGSAVKGISKTDAPINTDFSMVLDGCPKWESGAAVTKGARLTSDAQGRCITAAAGNTVTARALSDATAAGQDVLVLMTREGVA